MEFRGPKGDDGSNGVSITGLVPYWKYVNAGADEPAKPSVKNPGDWSTSEPAGDTTKDLYRTDRVDYSDGLWQWTSVQKVSSFQIAKEAMTVAANLRSAVEAGLMRFAKASNPPAPFKGGVWAVLDEATGSKMVGLRNANSAGTAWVPYQIIVEDLMVVGTGGTIQLKDNVVTAGTIQATNDMKAKFAEIIDLSANTAAFNAAVIKQAFVQEMVGTKWFVETFSAEKISVSGTNLLQNINFQAGWHRNGSTAAVVFAPINGPGDAPALVADAGTSSTYAGYYGNEQEYRIPCDGAEQFVFGGWFYFPDNAYNGTGVTLGLQRWTVDGVRSTTTTNLPAAPQNTWTYLEVSFANVAATREFGIYIAANGSYTDRFYVANPAVRRKVSSVLIEDNAITSPKIMAKSIEFEHMKGGALDAFTITSPIIQSVQTASRGIKWNGATLIGYTSAGAEAFRLDGTRATITAGTIQTATSGARVVLDTNGLKAYNASGLETTTITGATGAVSGWSLSGSTITGGLIRTAETGQRIQINSEGLKAYNAAGTVTASILSGVGSFTGAQLYATDITGGTITGALIQTVGTSFRGVKMSSSGLFGYNASNVQTFSIASDTGLVTVTGGTLRSASGTARVELNSTGLKAYNSSGTLTSSIEAASGSFTGATITGGTIQTIATTNRGVKITSAGLQGWTNTGVLSAKISADGTDNLLVGKLYTSSPGSPGMILSKTGANLPGIWFSADGTTDDKHAAIYADDTYSVIFRGTTYDLGASEFYAPPVTKGLTVMGPTIGTTWENYPVLDLLQKNGRNSAGYFGWANAAGTLSVLRANDVIAAGRLQDRNAPTTTSAANVYMNPTAGNTNFGRLFRSTSVRAAKVDIQDVGTDPNCILDVAVRDWMDRTQLEDYTNLLEEHALHKAGVRDKPQDPKPKYPRRIPGVVAEELEEVGLGSFCTYDENTGELVGVMYDRLPLLLIPIVREQRDTIARLEQRISALGG